MYALLSFRFFLFVDVPMCELLIEWVKEYVFKQLVRVCALDLEMRNKCVFSWTISNQIIVLLWFVVFWGIVSSYLMISFLLCNTYPPFFVSVNFFVFFWFIHLFIYLQRTCKFNLYLIYWSSIWIVQTVFIPLRFLYWIYYHYKRETNSSHWTIIVH